MRTSLVVVTALAAGLVVVPAAHADRGENVVMRLSTTTLEPGGTVVVKGVVGRYIFTSRTATLQKRFRHGGWIDAGSHPVGADRTYSFPETPTTTKSRYYRVCSGSHCSRSIFVTVAR